MGKFAPSTPAAPAPPPVPTMEDPAVAQRKKDVERGQRRRRGLGGTVNTSGAGAEGSADTRRSTLLGE